MEKLQLVLSDFQGPLDLLLHLIRQSKIDIYNIPIAGITEQYMEYLHKMNVLQLDIAGDYLVMAATLMRI
ncbi:MAG: segregation and condensation protein A, partial [Bombilactobacillus sp.]